MVRQKRARKRPRVPPKRAHALREFATALSHKQPSKKKEAFSVHPLFGLKLQAVLSEAIQVLLDFHIKMSNLSLEK